MNDTLKYICEKYNINPGKEYFIDIPQMIGSVDLAKLFEELGFTLGIEIGTDQGEFTEVLLKTNPLLRLGCVDPWKAEAYDKGEQPESGENQEFFDKRYQDTVNRLDSSIRSERVKLLRMTSMNALNLVEDNVLDFVYIDGNHDFLNVTQDFHYWLKKVKPGGIISGHDYVNYPFAKYNHVKRAVQAYATSYNLFPLFAVMQDKNGLKRDRFRSWFYVKQ